MFKCKDGMIFYKDDKGKMQDWQFYGLEEAVMLISNKRGKCVKWNKDKKEYDIDKNKKKVLWEGKEYDVVDGYFDFESEKEEEVTMDQLKEQMDSFKLEMCLMMADVAEMLTSKTSKDQ